MQQLLHMGGGLRGSLSQLSAQTRQLEAASEAVSPEPEAERARLLGPAGQRKVHGVCEWCGSSHCVSTAPEAAVVSTGLQLWHLLHFNHLSKESCAENGQCQNI